MFLPEKLKESLKKQFALFPIQEIGKRAKLLSKKYRENRDNKYLFSKEDYIAYAALRMPATYAAVKHVFSKLPGELVSSYLDLGAGPGTGYWAADSLFASLERIVLVEREREFIELGKNLIDDLKNISWVEKNLKSYSFDQEFDLVSLCYVLSEMKEEEQSIILNKAWKSAKEFLVVIEPGTPKGFSLIRRYREELIKSGAHLFAPCPHERECPMKGGDWCHFSQRLERTFEQKYVKEASMGYEDEKFSYIVFSKQKFTTKNCRMIKPTLFQSGHLKAYLCTDQKNLLEAVFSRKDGQLYSQMKKIDWGDSIDVNLNN